MLLKPLTAVAGLLALPAAQAFLIPPEVSDADIHVANTIESIGSHVAESQVVDVDCPDCPVLVRGRRGRPVQVRIDRATHLELTFSIDHQPDHDRLLVNGFELYPAGNLLRDTLMAPQIIDREDKGKRHSREHDRHDHEHRKGRHHRFEPQPQRLGLALSVGPAQKDADGLFELLEVELQIIGVGPALINGVPNVRVKLIKDAEGRLLMSQIVKGEPKKLLAFTKLGASQCKTAMCRWLAAAREKVKSFKGRLGHCHGGAVKGGMHPPAVGGASDPHHHPAGGHWRAPYRERRWGKLLQYIASHIILPVLIGIVAGVSVSLIGMAVGTVVVSLWRVLFRRRSSSHRRRRSHSHRKAMLKEAALVEEKSGLMEHQDAPPAYEDEEPVKTSPV